MQTLTLSQISSMRANIAKIFNRLTDIYIFRWGFFLIEGGSVCCGILVCWDFLLLLFLKRLKNTKKWSYLNHFSGTQSDQLLHLAVDSFCLFLQCFSHLEVRSKTVQSRVTFSSFLWKLQFTYPDPPADTAACYWRRFLLTAWGKALTVPGTLFQLHLVPPGLWINLLATWMIHSCHYNLFLLTSEHLFLGCHEK